MMAPQEASTAPWQPAGAALPPAAEPPVPPPGAAAPLASAAVPNGTVEPEEPPPPPPPQLVVDCPPGMPQPVVTETTAISLQWSPVSCTVLSVVPVAVEYVLNYQLQMQQLDEKTGGISSESWSVQYTGTASFVQVKGLRPGRSYAARVVVQPVVTNLLEVLVSPSPPSEVVAVHTLPCPPMGQPAPVLASRAKKELKFKWAEPEETGGRALEYTLEMTPAPEGWSGSPASADGFFEVYRGPERAWLAKRLVPGVQYCVRVKTANSEGESAWSPLAVFYTQATVPSWAPSDAPFVWDTTSSSVTLGWPEPAANGGTVTGYEVEMDDGAGFRHMARSAERQCMVQGLRSGILYKFRVRAENEAGRSLWSPLGEGRTAAVPPGPCSAPATMGSSQTSLSIRWEGPGDDGGSTIQQYHVEIRPKSAAAVQGLADEWLLAYQGRDTACTISNLRAGCVYMVRACAISQAGTGAFSGVAMLQTAPGNPDCPGAPQVVGRQQTELAVAWAPPTHDGGTPIASYRLEMCSVGGVEDMRGGGGKGKGKVDPGFELAYLGPERTAVVPDLEPGHRYSFRCSAMNEQGSSGWGPTVQAETLPGLPFEVDSLHLVATGPTSLKLRWSQPYGRGARVTGYALEAAPTAELEAAQAEVAAHQEAAAAAAEQQQEAAEAEAGADGQQGAGAELQQQQQQQQHEQPANGVPRDPQKLFQPVYQGADTSCTVSGLEPHTSYTLRVRAINAVGSSLSEPEGFQTAPAAPAAPQALALQQAGAAAVALSWQPPRCDHGAPVTGYQLEAARAGRAGSVPANAWRPAYQGAQTRAQVDGLEPGTRYRVRVRAANACGWGPWCEPLACDTSPDVPAAPPGLSAKAVGTTVRAAWEAAEDNGAPVTAYELEMAGGRAGGKAFAAVCCGDVLSHRVQQLEASSAYRFRVRAVNAVGPGPYSEEVAVQTTKAPPSPPADLSARLVAPAGEADASASCSGYSLEVSWEAAPQGPEQAAVMAFEVEAGTAAHGTVRQTVPASARSATLTGLLPGCAYTLRARGVGVDNVGHSDWAKVWEDAKEGERRKEKDRRERRFAVPGVAPAPRPAPAAEPSEEHGSGHKAHKRRGGGGAQQGPRAAAVTKTVAARAPPRKGYAAWDAWLRKSTGGGFVRWAWVVIGIMVCLAVAAFVSTWLGSSFRGTAHTQPVFRMP